MPSKISHEINKLRGETKDTGEVFTSTLAELQNAINASEVNIADLDSKDSVLDSKFRKQELKIHQVHNLVKRALYEIKNYQIKNVIASDTLIHSNPDEKSQSGANWTKIKETEFNGYTGTVRISFDGKEQAAAGTGSGMQFRINGVVQGSNIDPTTSYVTYSRDLAIQPGDLIQIYTADDTGACLGYVKNLNISGTVSDITQTSQDP